MAIEQKKRMLVPLGTPRQPSLSARVLIGVLRPLLLLFGFIFGNLYKVCFGWLDRRLAKGNERRFADDIRSHLSFLFTEHGAQIIPVKALPSRRVSTVRMSLLLLERSSFDLFEVAASLESV